MSAQGKLRILSDGKHGTFCPGCQEYHIFDSRWTFDGNYEQPTFNPSLLIRIQADQEEPEQYPATVCHSFLTAGIWHFLGDCTHALANQQVPAREEAEDWRFAEEQSISSVKKYIDDLTTRENETFLIYCYDVWQNHNEYFLRKGQALKEPDACIGEEAGFMYTWENINHYLEFEILENRTVEVFYKNRQTNELYGTTTNSNQPLSPKLVEKLSLFIEGRANV